ncbi:hypothetical protein [Ilumatobacter nonamiensis]|uniref:hypothetical protein n=1 Tax=Ilumatobacter nonamiensis TaxID=467093 RepID=UPI00034B3BCD|nr:hypothetical protein [Ilumatobacter nonamiensis]
MLQFQIKLLSAWMAASDVVAERLAQARDDDRGEVNAHTAFIVLLVIAAIAAGGIIAGKITDNANSVPSP